MMRRPHVYERSAPRSARTAYHEPEARSSSLARDIAGMLPALLLKAEAGGLTRLALLIRGALDEAEHQARESP